MTKWTSSRFYRLVNGLGVLVEGRGRIIREIEPGAKGIVMAYWPGSQGARAIANVLFGDANPSGKLPFTYARYANHLSGKHRARALHPENRAQMAELGRPKIHPLH